MELNRRAFLIGGAFASIFAAKGGTAPIPIGKESQLIEDSQKKELWEKESEMCAEEMLSAYFQLPHNTDVEALTPYGKKVLAEAVTYFLYNGFSKGYPIPQKIFEQRTNMHPLRDVLTHVLEQTKESSLRRVSSGILGEVIINKIALGVVIYLFKDATPE